MERELFCGRLRARGASDAPANMPHPVVHVDGVPLIRYEQDLGDLLAAFVRNARSTGATVERVDSFDAFVSSILDETGANGVVLSADPETVATRDVLARRDADILPFDGPRDDAEVGIVGAAFGIAATGTVVFDASRAGGRSASLLPPVIVVLLRLENIVRDAGELFRRMGERFPRGIPSQLVLCTGPSKSADIEQQLTTGVHGPGRVWIGLVG